MSHTLDSLRYTEQAILGMKVRSYYGRKVPSHVAWVESSFDPMADREVVRWITDDGRKHHIAVNLPMNPDTVNAVIVAMKLSY